jgi:hypothetical protein
MDTSPHTPPEQKPVKKRRFRNFAVIFSVIVIFILFIIYFICGLPYSEGTRSGVLTKISKKGFVFKTYEGEMNVGGFSQGDGTIMPSSIFKFSVAKRSVYEQLEAVQGRRVVVHYKQVIKNFFWQGESDYFVESVNYVK